MIIQYHTIEINPVLPIFLCIAFLMWRREINALSSSQNKKNEK